MIECLIGFILLLVSYYSYQWIIKPRRLIRNYVKSFRNAGYKVKEYPFNFLGAPYFQNFKKAADEKDDPLYYHKNEYYKVDMVITNVLNRPSIVLMN